MPPSARCTVVRLGVGIPSSHGEHRHTLTTRRPQMERETRGDMQSEPSREVVNNEIAYRWNQEVTAMDKLTNDELEVVYKQGLKHSKYLAYK